MLDICSLLLTLKAPIKTAGDDNFCNIFPSFRQKKKSMIFRQQMILMKYYALFVIFEKAAKLEVVVCCKL